MELTDDQCTILVLRGEVTDLEGEVGRLTKKLAEAVVASGKLTDEDRACIAAENSSLWDKALAEIGDLSEQLAAAVADTWKQGTRADEAEQKLAAADRLFLVGKSDATLADWTELLQRAETAEQKLAAAEQRHEKSDWCRERAEQKLAEAERKLAEWPKLADVAVEAYKARCAELMRDKLGAEAQSNDWMRSLQKAESELAQLRERVAKLLDDYEPCPFAACGGLVNDIRQELKREGQHVQSED